MSGCRAPWPTPCCCSTTVWSWPPARSKRPSAGSPVTHGSARSAARVVRAHGRLQEAGGIVWRDGGTLAYMHDAPATAPEANFVRDVDFCSGGFLMARGMCCRRWTAMPPMRCRMARRRMPIFACASPGRAIAWSTIRQCWCIGWMPARACRTTRRRAPASLERHGDRLRRRPESAPDAAVFARSAEASGRRILFIDDAVPARIGGGDAVRSVDLITVMATLGFQVTAFPTLPLKADAIAVCADLPDTIEAMHDRSLADLPDFLRHRAGYYDAVWIAHRRNLDRVGPILQAAATVPRVVLDTYGVAAAPDGDFALCRHVVTASEDEARQWRDLGFAGGLGDWRDAVAGADAAPLRGPSGHAVRRVRSTAAGRRITTRCAGSSMPCCRWWSRRWAGRRG